MLNDAQKKEMVENLKGIGARFTQMMEHIWGKGRIAHFFLAMDTGQPPTINFATNLRSHEIIRMLKLLIEKLEEQETKIIH